MDKGELRCKSCKTLLARVDQDGLVTIQRGGMQASFVDAQTAIIACYRCSTVNLFRLNGKKPDVA
jgi:phage FluMu protein Com